MKSKFFGAKAMMLMAALAVCGTFTSCYEKSEVDYVAPEQPEAPTYLIAGTVTNAATGEIMAGVAGTAAGTAFTTDPNGYYQVSAAQGANTITVSVSGYFDVTRNVYLATGAAGAEVVGNGDIALTPASEAAVEPEEKTPSTAEQAKAAFEASTSKEVLESAFDEDLNIVYNEDGTITATATADVTAAVGESVTVEDIPFFEGFDSSITPDFTKAVTDGQLWLASAEKALGRSYPMVNVTRAKEFKGVAGKSIAGYKLTIVMKSEELRFFAVDGSAIYQLSWNATPVYESHDSHDNHNNHGTTNGTGGGTGNAE